jgi:hypothetical protein
MSKNKTALDDFVEYCEKHPEERFWQALRNWSGAGFILACKELPPEGYEYDDTFYREAKA